jgi:N-acetylglucosamine malate deacetylase 1
VISFADQRILVVSAHTDDAELACGATIARALRDGATVRHVVVTDCRSKQLAHEFAKAQAILGVDDFRILHAAEVRAFWRNRQTLLDALRAERQAFEPTICLIPNAADRHQDHAALASECVRAFGDVPVVLAYEQPWNDWHFTPTLLVTVENDDVRLAIEAVAQYRSQAHRPYTQSMTMCAIREVRGLQACSASGYAEGFRAIRSVA